MVSCFLKLQIEDNIFFYLCTIFDKCVLYNLKELVLIKLTEITSKRTL